ncbi:MAG: 4-hydroxy-tetrahydrodipicolinate reductase [Nitrospira sp.]|nr:4-hydroxy-tetrahydrodipicolinate reductase [Nitrospira sp.]
MSSPINVTVTGAAGRMGKRLVALVHESARLRLAGATEAPGHPALGKDAGEVAGCGSLSVSLTDDLALALPLSDVVIDFTAPAATLHHVEQAVQHKRAMVIGTTGLSPDEMNQFRRHAGSIPCVQAPNMSVGITVLLQMIGKVAQALGDDYDLEIIDAHHNKKKDAPSGTALKLAEVLAAAKDWDLQEAGVYSRHGLVGERTKHEIGIQSVRAGDIVGDHTVLYAGPGERIEITHRAHNRDPFAHGALRAAEWVVHQPPGLYGMTDVLGLSR